MNDQSKPIIAKLQTIILDMAHTLEALESGQLDGSKTLKLACGLTEFPEEILSLADTLEVLDLSGNQLSELPDSIAQLKKLRIIFFAGNNFKTFPSILASCPALSMIGFKSNQIETIPENAFPPLLRWLILTDKLQTIPKWLFELSKLSWVAFSGNPITHVVQLDTDFEAFHWDDFTINELLGEGASGLISKANWKTKKEDVAIKVFKGDVTSDGLPEDEMKVSIAAGSHVNLIEVLGEIKGHPEDKSGLIMRLISSAYVNLGNPPSMETCTRDVFDEQTAFSEMEVLKISKSIASVCVQLHHKGINHGDLYAHNILVDNDANCLLGDFGAASFYDTNSAFAYIIERVEVRAFGCLVEDILSLVNEDEADADLQSRFRALITDCTNPDVKSRPNFSELVKITKLLAVEIPRTLGSGLVHYLDYYIII